MQEGSGTTGAPLGAARVLVADDEPVIRDVLVSLIEELPELQVVAVAATAPEAVAAAAEHLPDVALLDVRMPGGGGPAAARGIREVSPATRVIAFTAEIGGSALVEMLRAGVCGYVSKSASVDEVMAFISRTAAGDGADPTPSPMTVEAAAPPVRLLVVDDEPDVLDALVDLFAEDPSIELVGVARDLPTAVRMATTHGPDAALVDVGMPHGQGSTIAAELHGRLPALNVAAVRLLSDQALVEETLRSGSAGVVVRVASPRDLRFAVQRAARGAGEGLLAPGDELVVRVDAEETERRRVHRIERAIRGEGLGMTYQPIFNLDTGGVAEVEGFARFNLQPARSPEVWFREAHLAGLGERLELAAIREGLSAIDELPPGVGRLAFNVSPGVAASEALASILPAPIRSRVALQIQECEFIEDYAAFQRALDPLRTGGVRLELDAVGFGFRPNHIRRLAPDQLNVDIDVCRVGDQDQDQDRREILVRIMELASEMGATVVAAGIETMPQMELLRASDIDFGQGYYLAEPGPLAMVVDRG